MPPKPPVRLPSKPPRAAAPTNSTRPPRTRTPRPSASHPSSTSARYLKWASHGALFLCSALFLRDYFLDYQHVKGVSMAPTLNPHAHETGEEDSVIIVAWLAGLEERRRRKRGVEADSESSDGLKRGDVVTFWKPHRPGEISIKRIVGLPGDTVYPLRGYALDPGSYKNRLQGLPDGLRDVDEDAVESTKEEVGGVVVPYGHLWVEGDNWRKSLDSNDFGPVSKGLVIGRARWVWRGWWPFGEVGDARVGVDRERTRVVKGRAEVPVKFLE
ncbi:hypothetical protein NX059_002774 [Plenodomus lindquistii]|nr:hypothetical protein NX059_002774 [Plenodomus lindquistii]